MYPLSKGFDSNKGMVAMSRTPDSLQNGLPGGYKQAVQ